MAQQAGRDGAMTAAARSRLGRALIREVLEEEAEAALTGGRAPLDQAAEQLVADRVYADLWGLGGFQPYLDDPEVESVNANGCDQVFVQYADGRRPQRPAGRGQRPGADRPDPRDRRPRRDRGAPLRPLLPARVGAAAGRRAAVRGAGGHRQAVRGDPPRPALAAPGCASWSATAPSTSPSPRSSPALVRARKNLLISGGTAVGKTTMLRALASAIPPQERLITIEDSLELCLDWDADAHPDVVAMQSREPNTEGEGEITLAELVRWALRMTPDRVIVGEVRGSRGDPDAERHEPGQRRVDDHHPRQLLSAARC